MGALSASSLCSPGVRQVGQRVPEGCSPPMSVIFGLFCPIEPEDIMEQRQVTALIDLFPRSLTHRMHN